MNRLLRNGAGILFVLSFVVFVGVLAYDLLLMQDLYHSAATGTYQGPVPPAWISIVAAISGAISAAAVPFIGACVIERADKFLQLRSGGGAK